MVDFGSSLLFLKWTLWSRIASFSQVSVIFWYWEKLIISSLVLSYEFDYPVWLQHSCWGPFMWCSWNFITALTNHGSVWTYIWPHVSGVAHFRLGVLFWLVESDLKVADFSFNCFLIVCCLMKLRLRRALSLRRHRALQEVNKCIEQIWPSSWIMVRLMIQPVQMEKVSLVGLS